MSAKTKKTEKGSGVVHFNIHGDYLTNLARERWIEDNPKAAVNEWLYVFGLATHGLSFKKIHPISKTDIYNVLVAGGYLPTAPTTKHEKIKSKGGQF